MRCKSQKERNDFPPYFHFGAEYRKPYFFHTVLKAIFGSICPFFDLFPADIFQVVLRNSPRMKNFRWHFKKAK
jgi:hypothetical protein